MNLFVRVGAAWRGVRGCALALTSTTIDQIVCVVGIWFFTTLIFPDVWKMATGVMVAAVLTLLLLAWARVYRRVCRALKHAEDQVRELRGREAELRSRERDLEERIYEWRAARSSHPPWLFPSNPAYQERFMAGFIDYMDHPISLSRTPGPPVPPSLLAEIKKISQQPITLEPDKQPEPHTTLWDHLRD